MPKALRNIIKDNLNPYIYYLLLSLCLSAIFTIGVSLFNIEPKFLILILALGCLLLFVFKLKLLFVFLIVSLFVKKLFLFYWVSLLIVPFLILSYMILKNKIKYDDLKTPINHQIIMYFLTMLLSLINSSVVLLSMAWLFNYFCFIAVIFLFIFSFNEPQQLKRYITVFLLGVFLNSAQVIYLYLSNFKRPFGFSGVIFADYVALGLIISICLIIYSKGWIRNILFGLIALYAMAFLFSETRGSWFAFAAAFLFILIFLFYKSSKVYLKRKNILIYLSLFSLLILINLIGFEDLGASAAFRLNTMGQVSESINTTNEEVENSLTTRLFIWHTAYNAFMAHPIIGIGIYSFSYTSGQYYTIPEIYFRKYVKTLMPHEHFIGVLAETGILGLTAFILLLIGILRFNFKCIEMSQTIEAVKYSVTFMAANIYIICSMFITDAWMWGHGLMLWGIILGMSLVNYNYLKKNITVL